MIEEDSKALNIILEDICKRCGATHVFAIDVDGIPISAYSLSGYFNFEVSTHIAGLVGASFETGAEIGKSMQIGTLDLTFSLFKKGVLIGKRLEGILIVLTIPEVIFDVKRLYTILQNYDGQLEPLLPSIRIFDDSSTEVEELKSLFASELDNFDGKDFF